MANSRIQAPLHVRVLSIILFLFGFFALFGSLFLWGQGFILSFPKGADLSFPVADIFVNAPACILASVGL